MRPISLCVCLLLTAYAVRAQDAATDRSTRDRAAQPAPESASPAEAVRPKRVQYGPGVLIDWATPHVEIAARVVLREGLMELLACSIGSKEHESILATAAEPQKIREALGLIGLEAGRPPTYDPTTRIYRVASGAALEVDIVWQDGDTEKRVAAHNWFQERGADSISGRLPWIFCGSRLAGGRMAADAEGTLFCVVDFDSALVGLAERHSSDDANLWLSARTEAIPPVGTPCRLIVRRRADTSQALVLQLTPEGFFVLGDKVLGAMELDELIKDRIRENPDQKVDLTPMQDTSNLFARVAARAIIGSGIKVENMSVHLHPEPDEPAEASTPDSSPANPEEVPGQTPVSPPAPNPGKPGGPATTPADRG